MARGQKQHADTQLATTNDIGHQQQTRSNKLEDSLTPGYTSMMDTGYMNPQDEEAATNTEMGATSAPFQTADFKAKNTAAATRNPADLAAQQDQLAISEGQSAGDAAAKLQTQKMTNQEAGMYGLQQLQAGNQKEAEGMYGLGPGTLDARAAGQSGDAAATGYVNAFMPKKGG
jgi:hypothetical protein